MANSPMVSQTTEKPSSSGEEEKSSIGTTTVNWDGSDDPLNPRNWATYRKCCTVFIVTLLTFLGPMSSTMFAPSVTSIITEFKHNDNQLSALTISIYLVGGCLGPLVLAPLGEQYGRNILYNFSNIFFLISVIAGAISTNLAMFIVFRFLQGVAGSVPMSLAGGTIADIFEPTSRGSAMAIWTTSLLLAPVIGPTIGGFIATSAGWRWVFWFMSILTGVATLLTLALLRETYEPILLKRKSRQLQKLHPGSKFDLPSHDSKAQQQSFLLAILRPTRILLRSPIAMLVALHVGLIYGYIFFFYTAITPTFRAQYGFSISAAGLSFLSIGLGFVLGQICTGIFSDFYLKRRARRVPGNETVPEDRLPPILAGTFFVAIGLVFYGWTTQYKVACIVPMLALGLVGLGCCCCFLSASVYLVDSFGIYAASATAANTVVRSLFGAVLPLASDSLYDRLGYGWGNTLLGLIALMFAFIPFFLFKYGKRLRENPKFQM